jgi:pimeloyl-ACP methyl ester carboxylesterase
LKLEQRIAITLIRTRIGMLGLFSRKKAAEKAFQLFCTPQRKAGKKTAPVFENAEKLSLSVHDMKVVGYRWNRHSGSRKCLVIHGFESSARNFDRYISLMIDKGYEVMAFDAPAHGESEGKQINVLIYKEMLELIYTNFGPIDAFISHSFGGLAISLALEELPHNENTKVVLIAPATETSSSVDLLFNILQLNGEIRKEFDKLIADVGKKPLQWYSISRALENIKAKLLWVHDEEDTVTPFHDVKAVIERKHPHIEFLITKGWGHRRIYREEKVVARIGEFLS